MPSTFEAHRPQAQRAAVGPGVDALGHVVGRALVVVAHEGEDIGGGELVVGLDPQGIGLGAGHAAVEVGGRFNDGAARRKMLQTRVAV